MQEHLTDILIFMKTNLEQDLSIEDIASHFGYSKFYFSRKFKRLTGFSASDYLSSLKIEQAKQALLRKQADVTHASVNAGFSSLGSFSSNFSKKTGLSPREYMKQVEDLYLLAQEVDESRFYHPPSTEIQEASSISVSVLLPENYRSAIIFIGLFKTPIPNHRPIAGAALKKKMHHTFSDIPPGTYYLLACSIELTHNPLRFFDLSECLRGKVATPITLPNETHNTYSIILRPPLPEDPPIVINLPKLLAETLKK